MRLSLSALILALSFGASATQITKAVYTAGDTATIAVGTNVGFSYALTAGFVGTLKVQTSFDSGVTFNDEPTFGAVYVGVSSTVANGSGSIPGGATHMRLAVVTSTLGFTTVQLNALPSSGPSRATATAALSTLNDYFAIPVDPSKWASVRITSPVVTGTVAPTSEYSTDGGTNWATMPYVQRTDVVSANPAVAVPGAALGTSGSAWLNPLPGNATHVRLRAALTGTLSGGYTLSPGQPLVPGVPVVAVLYDVTEGSIGAGISTGTLDVGGWASVGVFGIAPTGQPVRVQEIDDAASNLSYVDISAAASGYVLASRAGGQYVATLPALASNGMITWGVTPRRLKATILAGGTVATGRIRVEASR